MNALSQAFSGPVVFALFVALICLVLALLRELTKAGRIQTRSATPVDSVNEGGVLRAVDQQFSVHSQR